jgi:hypothetical protein
MFRLSLETGCHVFNDAVSNQDYGGTVSVIDE